MNRMLPLAVVIGAALVGCATEPDVDPRIQDMIDTLEENGDCTSLQAQFDRFADMFGRADELEAIDRALRSAGCYD